MTESPARSHAAVTFWLFVYFVPLLFSCDSEKASQSPKDKARWKIKVISESLHEPLDSRGGEEYYPEIAENSFITKSMFDRQGNMTSQERYNAKGTMVWRQIFTYDANGNNLESKSYDFGKMAGVRKNKFNKSNQLIESIALDANGKILEKQVIRQEGDSTIFTTLRSTNAQLVRAQESTYDRKERNLENRYFSGPALIRQEMYSYDDKGNRIESIENDFLRNEERIIHFKYDTAKNHIETIVMNRNLMLESRTVFAYDDQRNPVKAYSYGLTGNLKERKQYTYEYDQANHWIKNTRLINGRVVTVTIRKIEYY